MNKKLSILTKQLGYCSSFSEDEGLDLLGKYLTDDVGPRTSSWRTWLADDTLLHAYANYTSAHKRGENIVIVYMHSDEDEKYSIEISRAQFEKILDEWELFWGTKNAKELIITRTDDGIFKFQIIS